MTSRQVLRVAVVGGGIIGLSCALLLRRAGHTVTLVTADPVTATTSHLAAAVWFPTAAGPGPEVLRWGAKSFGIFQTLVEQGAPGLVMRESLAVYRADPGTPDWVAAVGGCRPADEAELPDGYTHGLRFAVPLVEMPLYLPYLLNEVAVSGCRILEQRVQTLGDVLPLHPDIIVNAAGIAAAGLAGDDSVFPVRGQIVRVPNPGLSMSLRDEEHPLGRAYVHPRSRDVILGGTFEPEVWDTTPDPATTQSILRRCADLVPALARLDPLQTVVGLRPGRSEIRLEWDRDLLPVPVLHNYGHGGSGVTVAWGCAREAVALIRRHA